MASLIMMLCQMDTRFEYFSMKFVILKDLYTIYQFPTNRIKDLIAVLNIPQSSAEEFFSLTVTTDEVSLVAPTTFIEQKIDIATNLDVRTKGPWKVFKIQEILDFGLVGILRSIATVLADCNISIFVVSTFNTDFILVQANDVKAARDSLILAGYMVSGH
jgi:hypothetical protein